MPRLYHHHREESLLPAFAAILLVVSLQIFIASKFTIGPKFLLPALEIILLVGVAISTPNSGQRESRLRRNIAFLLITVVTIVNIAALAIVCSYLIGGSYVDGHQLLYSALAIYLTNIVMFGLWYWEMDSPGLSGSMDLSRDPDFLFPQTNTELASQAAKPWSPRFFDYLYISITNATAFSPTDTLPLTHRAKLLMSVQSIVSLVTVVLVTARAVNILG